MPHLSTRRPGERSACGILRLLSCVTFPKASLYLCDRLNRGEKRREGVETVFGPEWDPRAVSGSPGVFTRRRTSPPVSLPTPGSARSLLDPEGRVRGAYGVDGMPTTVLIGRDGEVKIHRFGATGAAQLQQLLKRKAFGESLSSRGGTLKEVREDSTNTRSGAMPTFRSVGVGPRATPLLAFASTDLSRFHFPARGLPGSLLLHGIALFLMLYSPVTPVSREAFPPRQRAAVEVRPERKPGRSCGCLPWGRRGGAPRRSRNPLPGSPRKPCRPQRGAWPIRDRRKSSRILPIRPIPFRPFSSRNSRTCRY
jgi:hypothetical protein